MIFQIVFSLQINISQSDEDWENEQVQQYYQEFIYLNLISANRQFIPQKIFDILTQKQKLQFKIECIAQLPTLIELKSDEDVQQLFNIAFKIVQEINEVQYDDISVYVPSCESFLVGQYSYAESVSGFFQDLLFEEFSPEYESYLLKATILKIIPQLLVSIQNRIKNKNQKLENNNLIKTICGYILKYICPLILAIINSSTCGILLKDCYYAVKTIFEYIDKLYNSLEINNTNIFSKHRKSLYSSRSFIGNKRELIDKTILSFKNIITLTFYVIPYLKCQLVMYQSQLKEDYYMKILKLHASDSNNIFSQDDLYNLQTVTYPTYETLEDCDFNDLNCETGKIDTCITDQLTILRKTAKILSKTIQNTYLDNISQSPEQVKYMFLLCFQRQLQKRPLHQQFLMELVLMLQQIITANKSQQMIDQKNIEILQQQFKQIQDVESENSLKTNEISNIEFDDPYDICLQISKVLVNLNQTEQCHKIIQPFLQCLLQQDDQLIKQYICYLFPSLIPLSGIPQLKQIVQYYYKQINSNNQQIVIHYIRNLGNLIGSFYTTYQYNNYIQFQVNYLGNLIVLAYNLFSNKFKVIDLPCKLFDSTQTCKDFSAWNMNMLPYILFLYLQVKMSEQSKKEINQTVDYYAQSKQKIQFYQIFLDNIDIFHQILSQDHMIQLLKNSIQQFQYHQLFSIINICRVNDEYYKIVLQHILQMLYIQYESVMPGLNLDNVEEEQVDLGNNLILSFKKQFINKIFDMFNIQQNQKKSYFHQTVIDCQHYQRRLVFAQRLPQLLFYLQKQDQNDQIVKLSVQFLVALFEDPVRKIRTQFIQKFGALIAALNNIDKDISYFIYIIKYFITDESDDKIIKMYDLKYLNNIQRKSQVCDLLESLITVSKNDPYEKIKELIELLIQDQSEIVQLSIVKSIYYLAYNGVSFVYQNHYIQQIKQIQTCSQSINNFKTLYMELVNSKK